MLSSVTLHAGCSPTIFRADSCETAIALLELNSHSMTPAALGRLYRGAGQKMRWFYILLIATGVAGVALALDRYMGSPRHSVVQVVVGAALFVIFVAYLGFLSKLRD